MDFKQSTKEQQGEIRKPSSVINAKKQRKTTEWERLHLVYFARFERCICGSKRCNRLFWRLPQACQKRKRRLNKKAKACFAVCHYGRLPLRYGLHGQSSLWGYHSPDQSSHSRLCLVYSCRHFDDRCYQRCKLYRRTWRIGFLGHLHHRCFHVCVCNACCVSSASRNKPAL